MRRKLLINCAAAALAASFGATAWAGNKADSSQAQAEAPPAAGQYDQTGKAHRHPRPESPEGYVLLEENTVYLMANEPQQHLLQAHADLARNNDRASAEETRLAAAYLDMQAARRGDGQDQDLKKCADHLRHIARELEHGKANISADQLDRDFARASDTLARHFDNLTKYDLQKQHYLAAGYDLRATANTFRNTIVWSDQKPSKDDLAMIRNAHEIATNLRSNEVYKGEKALKGEQKAWSKEGKESDEKPGEAQPANAKLPAGVTNSPLTGTTPAEANNDVQHAQKMADALGRAIDKFGNTIENSKSEAAGHNEKTSGSVQKENAISGKESGNSQKAH